MGVMFKFHIGETEVPLSEHYRGKICWGFLKRVRVNYLLACRGKEAKKLYDIYKKRMGKIGVSTYTNFRTFTEGGVTQLGHMGLNKKDLDVGITAITALINGKGKEKAIKAIIKMYPKLMDGVSVVRGERITEDHTRYGPSYVCDVKVSCNKHYAILYNQLRILSNISRRSCMYNMSELSNPLILPRILMFSNGQPASVGDGQLFKMSDLTMEDIDTLVTTRDWVGLTQGMRKHHANNFIKRKGAHKAKSNSFVIMQEPVKGGYLSSDNSIIYSSRDRTGIWEHLRPIAAHFFEDFNNWKKERT